MHIGLGVIVIVFLGYIAQKLQDINHNQRCGDDEP